ncbi:Uu.00g053370.m01.CDS01 [Anthostomella pinea]|uniref:Uu.00g053370.m01.CDS01 n=1 Tax=Anthostomella pinea TaxID=933095 RepID=A0AAI8VWD1_9PEZI|nr:Uu.00g053370.m01.CDS01 [Anthostomella pinea]
MAPAVYKQRSDVPRISDGNATTTIQTAAGDQYTVRTHLLAFASKLFRDQQKQNQNQPVLLLTIPQANTTTIPFFVLWLSARCERLLPPNPFLNDPIIDTAITSTMDPAWIASRGVWMTVPGVQNLRITEQAVMLPDPDLPAPNVRERAPAGLDILRRAAAAGGQTVRDEWELADYLMNDGNNAVSAAIRAESWDSGLLFDLWQLGEHLGAAEFQNTRQLLRVTIFLPHDADQKTNLPVMRLLLLRLDAAFAAEDKGRWVGEYAAVALADRFLAARDVARSPRGLYYLLVNLVAVHLSQLELEGEERDLCVGFLDEVTLSDVEQLEAELLEEGAASDLLFDEEVYVVVD